MESALSHFFVNFFFGSFCWLVWIKIEVDFNFLPIIFLHVLLVMQQGGTDRDSFYWRSKSLCWKSAARITDNLNTSWMVLKTWMESSVKLPTKAELEIILHSSDFAEWLSEIQSKEFWIWSSFTCLVLNCQLYGEALKNWHKFCKHKTSTDISFYW